VRACVFQEVIPPWYSKSLDVAKVCHVRGQRSAQSRRWSKRIGHTAVWALQLVASLVQRVQCCCMSQACLSVDSGFRTSRWNSSAIAKTWSTLTAVNTAVKEPKAARLPTKGSPPAVMASVGATNILESGIRFAKRRPDWQPRHLHEGLRLSPHTPLTTHARSTCAQCGKSRAWCAGARFTRLLNRCCTAVGDHSCTCIRASSTFRAPA
jgi:hypothetical protein